MNDAKHPAAPGSTVTVLASGLGLTNPTLEAGSIAANEVPVIPVFGNPYGYWPSTMAVPATVATISGFITAVFQVRLPVPRIDTAGQVERLPLTVGGSTIAIYVK